jgi:hypothetical protein
MSAVQAASDLIAISKTAAAQEAPQKTSKKRKAPNEVAAELLHASTSAFSRPREKSKPNEPPSKPPEDNSSERIRKVRQRTLAPPSTNGEVNLATSIAVASGSIPLTTSSLVDSQSRGSFPGMLQQRKLPPVPPPQVQSLTSPAYPVYQDAYTHLQPFGNLNSSQGLSVPIPNSVVSFPPAMYGVQTLPPFHSQFGTLVHMPPHYSSQSLPILGYQAPTEAPKRPDPNPAPPLQTAASIDSSAAVGQPIPAFMQRMFASDTSSLPSVPQGVPHEIQTGSLLSKSSSASRVDPPRLIYPTSYSPGTNTLSALIHGTLPVSRETVRHPFVHTGNPLDVPSRSLLTSPSAPRTTTVAQPVTSVPAHSSHSSPHKLPEILFLSDYVFDPTTALSVKAVEDALRAAQSSSDYSEQIIYLDYGMKLVDTGSFDRFPNYKRDILSRLEIQMALAYLGIHDFIDLNYHPNSVSAVGAFTFLQNSNGRLEFGQNATPSKIYEVFLYDELGNYLGTQEKLLPDVNFITRKGMIYLLQAYCLLEMNTPGTSDDLCSIHKAFHLLQKSKKWISYLSSINLKIAQDNAAHLYYNLSLIQHEVACRMHTGKCYLPSNPTMRVPSYG